MNFTQSLVTKLADRHLLKHPFYQAWTEGTLSMDTLRLYASQYYHHVRAFPRYLSATHSHCDNLAARQVLLENLIDEEKGTENHPELWLRFAEGLGAVRADIEADERIPEIRAVVDTFMKCAQSSYEEGLGALFAYEHQIPEIAVFKRDALTTKYGVSEPRAVAFFDIHAKADVYHTQALSGLLDELSPEGKEKAEKAAEAASKALWAFLDGIQSRTAVHCA